MEGTKTPAGSAGQVRPRRRFGAEEAHRPPRGKRSAWNGNQLASYPASNRQRMADEITVHYADQRKQVKVFLFRTAPLAFLFPLD
ncbi:hypothetical protein B1A98_11410 [Bacillus badius]|nr:hypothetical protein B1A98_11410 [Bacillus badius]